MPRLILLILILIAGALGGFLFGQGVEVLICGGIGGGAQTALTEANIKFFGGVKGEADKAVESFIKGELEFDPNAKCNHHPSFRS